MHRLFSGNLIGCVGYSITRVSRLPSGGRLAARRTVLSRLFAEGREPVSLQPVHPNSVWQRAIYLFIFLFFLRGRTRVIPKQPP